MPRLAQWLDLALDSHRQRQAAAHSKDVGGEEGNAWGRTAAGGEPSQSLFSLSLPPPHSSTSFSSLSPS
eukprot:scaffold65872_cov35-Tisochrysis_lutea.AAC.2